MVGAHDRRPAGYRREMSEQTPEGDEYEDQDAEPTMTAPEEGRPDGHVAEDDQDENGDSQP